MKYLFHWCCLLSFALVAPIALPAGGATKTKIEFFNKKDPDICFAGDACVLYPFPSLAVESKNNINLGTTLRIIRHWKNLDGSHWLQVQVPNDTLFEAPCLKLSRGWINVGFLGR